MLFVPRWIQLVALPSALFFGWIFAGLVGHAIFVFLISAIIAMLLNPLVSTLTSLHFPRGLAVAVVYLSLAAAIVGAVGLAGVAAVNQVVSASDTVSQEFEKQPGERESSAERRVDRFQRWLDARGLGRVHVKDIGNRLVQNIQKQGVGDYAKRAVDIGQQVASEVVQGLIELLLILVISIYLLLDGPRISRGVDRVFPPGPDGIRLGPQVQKGLIRYVRGQVTVSFLIGASAGLGVYALSLAGIWPDGDQYALILGLWAAATEVIPYIGPILGALPAIVLAAIHSPATALWVGLFYLGVHQLEGHVIVPRVMGQALGAHPLLVIFALVAGSELYGIIGAITLASAARDGARDRALPASAHRLRALALGRLRRRGPRRHGAGAHRARTARAGVSAGVPLIACAGLIKRFGERQVLGPVDLALAAGDRLALLGPNGAGKTTLLSLLAGSADASAGTVQRPDQRQIGVVPQRPALYRRLSARENLELFARLARVPEPEAEVAELAAAVALGDALDHPVERLSLGQVQRVNVAIGLLGRPLVVLLDEPTAALDPGHRLALWSMLERVSERGGAFAFATQNVEEARLAADRVLVLVDGRAAYAGPQEAFWQEAGAVEAAGGHERAFVAFVERVRSAA